MVELRASLLLWALRECGVELGPAGCRLPAAAESHTWNLDMYRDLPRPSRYGKTGTVE